MYSYVVQQEDLNILKQSNRQTYIKVELINSSTMQIVETMEGQLIDDNFSCDGDSAVRRTYNCDFVITDSSFQVGRDKKIWVNRYIRVKYGIRENRTNAIRWYTIGTFSFVDVNYSFTTSRRSVSLSCSDLMANYDGTKGGKMTYENESQVTFKVSPGQSFYTVIVGLLTSAGITSYLITGVDGYSIPYEIEWEHGTTYCEALEQLRDLYDFWEFFFDENGRFIWRKTITGKGESLILDDSIIKPLVIDESFSDSFKNIYNATEVWGQELDIVDDDRYTTTCSGGTDPTYDNVFRITLSNYTYTVALSSLTWVQESTHVFRCAPLDSVYYSSYKGCSSTYTYQTGNAPGTLPNYGFSEYRGNNVNYLIFRDDRYSSVSDFVSAISSISLTYATLDNFDNVAIKVSGAHGRYININNTYNIPIYNTDGTAMAANTFVTNNVYVFRYRATATGDVGTQFTANFYLMGQYQAHGYYEETNANVPYSIINLGQKITNVIEMDTLYSDELCTNQAQYETYKSTAKQDSLSIQTIIIPFLEPSQKIRYTPLATDTTEEWMIKSYSWTSKSGTMNIELYRFSEDYSYVVRRNQQDN